MEQPPATSSSSPDDSLRLEIPERQQADAVLRQSEANLQAVFNAADESMLLLAADGTILALNDVTAQRTGYSREASIGRKALDLLPPEVAERRRPFVEQALATGRPVAFEDERHGRWMVNHIQPILGADGRVTRLAIFGRDITDRIRAEEAIRASEARFRAAIEASPVPMALNDGHAITFLNRAFNQAFGYTTEDLRTLDDWWPKAYPDPEYRHWVTQTWEVHFAQAAQSGEAFVPLEVTLTCRNGERRTVLVSASPLLDSLPDNHVAVFYDITERKQAEEEKARLERLARQVQKSQSLSRMAAAVAHRFGNQLQVVMGNLEWAKKDLPLDSQPMQAVTRAMEAVREAAKVSGSMLIYLGQVPGKRQPLDWSAACAGWLPEQQVALPQGILLESDLPSPGPAIAASAEQMREMLTNLITNAWESFDRNTGMIRVGIRTAAAADIEPVARFPVGWQPTEPTYACLEVADNGSGIAAEHIGDLFEPFFTTKFTGRGMGLPVVLGIVRAHGGAITVASAPGRGSSFRVYIPLSAEPVRPAPQPTVPANPAATGSTVLLVEDEQPVREMVALLLEHLGYSVMQACDGVEAVELFVQHKDQIGCVLCDLTMPRMDGWQTLAALRERAPGIPVVLASAHDPAQVMAGSHAEWPQAFLSKPYELAGMRDALVMALAGGK